MFDTLKDGNLPAVTATSRGSEYGYANPPIRAFFFRLIRRSAKIFVQIRNHSHFKGSKVDWHM